MSKRNIDWIVQAPRSSYALERWGWAYGEIKHRKAYLVRPWRCYRDGSVYIQGWPTPSSALEQEVKKVCRHWLASLVPKKQASLLGLRRRSR